MPAKPKGRIKEHETLGDGTQATPMGYTDANGNTVSAFQYDQTLIRAIAEHDFQLRHDSGCSVLQFVRWAPAIQ